jgi:hypothetical protein
MSKSNVARNFLCTRNYVNEELKISAEEYLDKLYQFTGARYVNGQLERGESGNLHIQFFVNFEKASRPSKINKYDKKAHVIPVLKDNGASTYCLKEETRVEGPWEFGEIPIQRNKKVDWDKVWECAKNNEIEKIPSSIRIAHYSKLKMIAKDYMKKKEDCPHLRGIWIKGKAGIGKSKAVREVIKKEDLYPKLCNKWWDGYQGEKYVVCDDVEPKHNVLSQQFKLWADHYSCILETKGGAVQDNYEWFIITSQYSIRDIFGDDMNVVQAIDRRYEENEFENEEEIINYLKYKLNIIEKKSKI